MKNIFLYLTIHLLLAFSLVNAQYLSNPSLEGPTGANLVPPSWQPCKANSTPDTQPGAWNCSTPPSNGSSYANLITRGNLGPSANTTEDMQTALLKPLLKGNCYSLSIDLALSAEWGHFDSWGCMWISYNQAVILKIWGGYGSCEKTELFWVSNPISNTDWITYAVIIFSAATDINYLILEAEYVSMPEYFGNVLIDNLVLTELSGLHVTKLDTTVVSEQSFQLNASSGTNYSWSPSEGLSCVNCQNPIVTVDESITYEVMIIDNNGCSFIEEFIINVEIFIPNVFTPNADGKNETFEIKGLPSGSSLQVFNRWGQKVYTKTSYMNDWNGKTNQNKELPAGVYYYVINAPSSRKNFNGTITLIR